MAVPFSRTLGAIRADRGRGTWIAGAVAVGLLAAWLVWLFAGTIAVYRTSERARIEVSPGPTQVAAPLGGRVVDAHLVVGTRVVRGAVLVALDTSAEQIALARARGRLAAIEPELASAERELAAEGESGKGAATADVEAERERGAKQRAAELALQQAEDEEKRTRKMVEVGIAPTAEIARANAETEQRRAALDAAIHSASGVSADRRQREAARDVKREQLARQRAELDAAVASARGEITQLEDQLERRSLRAPVDGVLGEVSALRPGAVVADGQVVATVVPDGELHVVAEYGPASIGRIVPGQRARVRLDAFPWTHYGTLAASVVRVGSELRDGLLRVELALASGADIPVAHAMTGTVEIEVEHASPADLLVRAIGERSDP